MMLGISKKIGKSLEFVCVSGLPVFICSLLFLYYFVSFKVRNKILKRLQSKCYRNDCGKNFGDTAT